MTDVNDLGAVYREHREGLSAFVAGLSPTQLATKLPACPDWSAREVIAHVAGIPADVAAGRLDGVGTDAWTQAHIDGRLGMTVDDIVTEWAETGSQAEAMASAAPPELVRSLISDLVTHDFDTRSGFGNTEYRDGAGAAIAYSNYANRLGTRLVERGESVRLIADGEEQIVGSGEVLATVRASRFELTRALTGRRSAAQVEAYTWEGDPAKFIDVFSSYPMRDSALDE